MREWFEGEHVPFNLAFHSVYFNQLLFLGENTTASTTTYAQAHWFGPLVGLPPTGELVRIRICDFYRMKGERISVNWMMLDLPDLLRQAGRRVLPRASVLPDDGWFQPPKAMDGIPAPYSPLTPPETAEASRAVARALLESEWYARGRAAGAPSLWAQDMLFYGPPGIGFAASLDEYRTHVLGALERGFTHRSFELDVLSCEGSYCGAHGYLLGTHSGCFLGEAATGRTMRLRVGLHWHIVDGIATEGYAMFDTPALFDQLGIDLLARAEAPPPCASPQSPSGVSQATAPQPVTAAAIGPPADTSSWSNECLLSGTDALQPPTANAPATFLSECPAWVVRTTDAVWRPTLDAASINASLEQYFYARPDLVRKVAPSREWHLADRFQTRPQAGVQRWVTPSCFRGSTTVCPCNHRPRFFLQEGWESVSTFGKKYKGMSALKELARKRVDKRTLRSGAMTAQTPLRKLSLLLRRKRAAVLCLCRCGQQSAPSQTFRST